MQLRLCVKEERPISSSVHLCPELQGEKAGLSWTGEGEDYAWEGLISSVPIWPLG